jgi:transcription elongation GreA/GreB family factor
MQEIKNALLDNCIKYVKERINTAESALEDNRAGLELDSKSSAGDKYETAREIVQQEVIRNELLLTEAHAMEAVLSRINVDNSFTTIQNGSLAITNHGSFFFAIAVGKVEINKKDYFIISISSPLGQAFKDKQAGDKVVFNGKTYQIKDVQ